ncbi:MAG: T9SS type A sorting domain-containing protein [Bacteroidales bacterium]
MKKNLFTFFVVMMCMYLFSVQAQSVFMNEHFDYPAGDSLTAHGWAVHGIGINTILVKSGSLNYNQYPVSVGNSAYLKNTGQDINRTFASQTNGSVYVAALVKIDSANTTGDYFMHFLRTSTTFSGRVFVKKSGTNTMNFGISKGSSTAVYSTTTYPMDSTYLIVLKYKFVNGATNDSVFLYVNPQFTDEGIPTVKATDAAVADLDSAFAIALRQGSSNKVNIDEIRVTNTWYNAIGYYTSPTVSTEGTSNITPNSATCSGNVLTNGGLVLTAKGICYDTIANPSILLNLFTNETGNLGSLGSFSSNLSGLMLGKTYHYRAYATNNLGTVYGSDSVFTTATTAVAPIVVTNAVSNLSFYSASISGEVISDGGANISTRGLCWDTVANPSITNNTVLIAGTVGTMSSNLSNLLNNITYHVRAYATNSIGSSYGSDVSFKTLAYIPTYTIAQIHTINPTTGVADSTGINCKLSGVVHGINYATNGYSFYMMNNNAGIFVYKTSSLAYTPVTEGDSIRVIGKIQQPSGLIYIAPDSIVKISSANTLQNPIVINNLSDTVESRLVKINNLTYLSGWPTSAGSTKVVYALKGTDTITIIVHTNCSIQGTPAPTTNFNIIGIVTQSDNTTPYLQGYMIYPRYLSDLTINYTPPIVQTSSVSYFSMTEAVCNGSVTATGGTAITARGICYGTSINPDTASAHNTVNGTTGIFATTLTGLTSATTYHYRAYAKNSTGVAYGADSSFTTASSPVLPLLSTDSVFTINYYTANIASKVINDGGGTISTRGVCWKTSTNPTILDSVSHQTGTTGAYVNSIGNLFNNTVYYVRSFATNSAGTAYGNELSFTTKRLLPTYSIQQVKSVDASGVADSITVNCKLTGVIHGLNYATTGYNFFIIDSTAGINVYKTSTLSYTPLEGDKVKIIGKIAQTNGLIQIIPDSLVKLSSANTLFNPITANLPNNDSLESKLVKIENLYYLSGWPTSAGNTRTVYTLKGADTVVLRIYSNCSLQGSPAPTATVSFSITGMVNQSDVTSPYTSSYQILPRSLSDLVINYSDPTVITGSVYGITQYTALCNGNIPTDGGHAITSRGICYGPNANPTTADSTRTTTATTGAYTINLTNLTLSTTYHYRAYGTNSLGTFYGNDSLFTTSATPVAPVLTTNAATAISYTSANVSGNLINNGGDTLTSKGICWAIHHNPTIADSLTIVTGTAATFSSTLNNLIDNTVYYSRAYAISASGTGYGNEISFTTKKLPVLYSISQVKGVNSLGLADSLNVNCKLIGVVHGINFKQTTTFTGYNFYILDATAGINVYKLPALTYIPLEGDSIRVIGKIAQVNGLIQMVPDSIVLISSGIALHTPTITTALNEVNESQFVKMETLTYVSGWPTTSGTSTASVLTLKGSDTITLRLYTNCSLQWKPAPTGTFNITGIVSQTDVTSPYLSGYVIIPRDSNDMLNTTGIVENFTNTFKLYPNPANGKVSISMEKSMNAEIKIYSLVGNLLLKKETTETFTTIDLSSFAKGVYFVNMANKSNGTSFTEKLIIQ